MTERDEFSEICITLNIKEYSEIFASEVADFTNEGLEFAESGAIIIRTSKNTEFIDALLAHLQDFCKDLSNINNQNITFSHTIEIKQNRDWIEEYRRSVKPLRCGIFYIYPPWEKPLVENSSLGMQFHTCEKFWESTDSGLVLSQNFSQIQKPHRNPKDLRAKRSNQYFDFDSRCESTTNQSKNAESVLDSAIPLQEANSSIFDEKSEFCETSDADKTNGLSRKRVEAISDLSQKDAEFATINILLEPSLAFGTGHHASTFMCIEAIQAIHAQDSLKNKKLLDFGCGSGILALCAEKLGAVVDLCDIDELAIIESKKNFNNNNATISHIWQGGIADRIAKNGVSGAKDDIYDIYDIIVANIIASVLIEQKSNIDSHLKRGGIAVLSGILDIYKDEVLARFSDFTPLAIRQSDEWICAVLQKA